MTRLRLITLRMLSPLFATGLGLLVTSGCPLPKQEGDDQGCDDGDLCGPNDPNCQEEGGDCDRGLDGGRCRRGRGRCRT